MNRCHATLQARFKSIAKACPAATSSDDHHTHRERSARQHATTAQPARAKVDHWLDVSIDGSPLDTARKKEKSARDTGAQLGYEFLDRVSGPRPTAATGHQDAETVGLIVKDWRGKLRDSVLEGFRQEPDALNDPEHPLWTLAKQLAPGMDREQAYYRLRKSLTQTLRDHPEVMTNDQHPLWTLIKILKVDLTREQVGELLEESAKISRPEAKPHFVEAPASPSRITGGLSALWKKSGRE